MDSISCYVDGIQVTGVETYIKVNVDGVNQYSLSEELDPGLKILSVHDFEVNKDWGEAKFFYGLNCIWTVQNNSELERDYELHSLFETGTSISTEIDSVVYSGTYEIQYVGAVFYDKEEYFSDGKYVVFKYHLTNKKSEEINLNLMGYNMRGYQDGIFLGNATYSLNDKKDGYINIYDIDSLAPEMSADIYVAFERVSDAKNVSMAYDDGYISHSLKCIVNDIIE